MPSQRDIKRRIDSVRNTRKITRAMELVASARLRRAQERIEALRPYAQAMRRLMAQAARQSGSLTGMPLLEERESVERAQIVVITGDRGLAGAFNVNILRRGYAVERELRDGGASEVDYVAVGKKGAGTLRFRGLPTDRTFQGFSTDPSFADAHSVAEHVVSRFVEGEVDRVMLVYNAFKSALEQRVTEEQLLPIPRRIVEDEGEDEAAEPSFSKALAFFEPDAKDFLETLLPTYLDTTVYRALLESAAAELGARRTAMRNASDNAQALIGDLTLAMNRARQAAITQEILEVVAGADALS
jgi:F-type H+-transporting ATPase subunit gamma